MDARKEDSDWACEGDAPGKMFITVHPTNFTDGGRFGAPASGLVRLRHNAEHWGHSTTVVHRTRTARIGVRFPLAPPIYDSKWVI